MINIRTINIIIILLFFGCMLISCQIRQFETFVDKHGTENFNEFRNKGFAIRNYDESNNAVVFISSDLNRADVNGPYIVSIDESSRVIKKTDLTLSLSKNIDTNELNALALKFMEFKVQKLSVDSNGNIFIGIKSNDRADLIYFSDDNYRIRAYKNWKRLSGNWYRSP